MRAIVGLPVQWVAALSIDRKAEIGPSAKYPAELARDLARVWTAPLFGSITNALGEYMRRLQMYARPGLLRGPRPPLPS